MEKKVLAIGRWMPIHLGHKEFLVNLANNYDKLVIGIGSCYENGTPRNCIPAVIREKLLRKIFKTEGIPDEKIEIVQIKDSDTFEKWIDDVIKVCKSNNITHFCTGNKEDILNVLEEKGIDLNLKMINPEINSSFPFHATDIRNAILNGEYDKLDEMIPAEIKDMVIESVSKEIIAANKGEGKKFIPGRQTVDLAFFVKNKKDEKDYVLIGKRKKDKIDFPNVDAIPGSAIKEFESPVTATIRTFYKETGLKVKVIDNSEEPATIIMQPEISNKKEKMNFIGIYASPDERVNGSRGGGTQCFSIYIVGDIEKIQTMLQENSDLENLRFVPVEEIPKMELAFEQKDMIIDACDKLKIDYLKEEKLTVLDETGHPTGEAVSRKKAHEEGILHGASHIYIYRRNDNGEIDILLQRRSHNKDSFPDCLDISSAGHMEQGMSFRETALKELSEELGLEIDSQELEKAFSQRFSNISNFKGKIFNNQEINTIYLLEKDLDISKLKLQKEEVSEVVWRNSNKILDDLKKEYSEYCLDIKEYMKVLEKIKEKNIDKGKDGKKNTKEDLAKKLYEDTILNGRFTNSDVVRNLAGRTNQYGEIRQISAMLNGTAAADIVKYINGDQEVARGIAIGLEFAKPNFEKIGTEFLKSKIPGYKKSQLGVAMTRVMLSGLSGKRVEAIIKGVEDALENKPEISEEAKAAHYAIEIYDNCEKYSDNMTVVYYYSSAMETVFEGTKRNGKISTTDEELMQIIREKKSEKDVIRRNPVRSNELDNAYQYYMKNFEYIPENYRKSLEGLSKQEIIAYYVVSMREENLHKLYIDQQKEK